MNERASLTGSIGTPIEAAATEHIASRLSNLYDLLRVHAQHAHSIADRLLGGIPEADGKDQGSPHYGSGALGDIHDRITQMDDVADLISKALNRLNKA